MEVYVMTESTKGFFVKMNKKEALKLIASLSLQIANDAPNSDREEFFTTKGEYFSIAVSDPVKTLKEKELEMDYIYNKIKINARMNGSVMSEMLDEKDSGKFLI